MAVKRAYSALSELRSAMSWQSLKTSSVYSFVWPVATILSMVSGMPLARMIDLEAGSYIRLARSAITSLEAAYNTGNGGISKQTEILGYRLPRTLWGRNINTYMYPHAMLLASYLHGWLKYPYKVHAYSKNYNSLLIVCWINWPMPYKMTFTRETDHDLVNWPWLGKLTLT